MELPITARLILSILVLWLTWKLAQIFILFTPRNKHSLRSVAVLVLGDIGRSPRMMYHAESLAENEFETHLIGYRGSKPIPALQRLPVVFHYLPEPPSILRIFPFFIAGPLKVIHQCFSILEELLVQMSVPPEFILVQNPPSIPTLALVQVVAHIRGCKVIIDWHNLGYSILQLKLRPSHPFVRVAKLFERVFGNSAYAHIFVTDALRKHLCETWHLRGETVVLHDRPPRNFHAATVQETHDLFIKLFSTMTLSPSTKSFLPPFSAPYSTPLTTTQPRPDLEINPESVGYSVTSTASVPMTQARYEQVKPPALRDDRPAVVISSTSWTPDEDFSILLDALKIYEDKATKAHRGGGGNGELPKLWMVVTGKGPLRDTYMKEVEELQEQWEWVRCVSAWLDAEDYPIALGSADLGISLHESSSKMDLPMKIVDMFGCGLPVCALGFECLDELVKEGINGLIFHNANELAEQLVSLFTSFPASPHLSSLRQSVQQATRQSRAGVQHHHGGATSPPPTDAAQDWNWTTWDENWDWIMRPLLLKDIPSTVDYSALTEE